MARWPRLVASAYPIHITQRGHNRERTFLDTHDFACYREILRRASERTSCAIHACALMTNHIHLLVSSDDPRGPSRLMQYVGCRFVPYWNGRHRRSGSLWEGRFKSSIVDTDKYFLACSRYIDLNPVRAGIVSDPDDYAWSSYLHLAIGTRDDLLTRHAAYEALGHTPEHRQAAYAAFCTQSQTSVSAIRSAVQSGSAMGGHQFIARLETKLTRRATRHGHGGDRRSIRWEFSSREIDDQHEPRR